MKAPRTIRIDPDVYYKARVAAILTKTTVGAWIEEAIQEHARSVKIPF